VIGRRQVLHLFPKAPHALNLRSMAKEIASAADTMPADRRQEAGSQIFSDFAFVGQYRNTIGTGRRSLRSCLQPLWTMVEYLRMNGVVPPASRP
jgi:hypothetical protein